MDIIFLFCFMLDCAQGANDLAFLNRRLISLFNDHIVVENVYYLISLSFTLNVEERNHRVVSFR